MPCTSRTVWEIEEREMNIGANLLCTRPGLGFFKTARGDLGNHLGPVIEFEKVSAKAHASTGSARTFYHTLEVHTTKYVES